MPMTINDQINPAQLMTDAMASGDAGQMTEAWQATLDSIAQSVRGDFELYQMTNDSAVLAQRGYRQLTSEENRFYEALTSAARQSDHVNARQAFLDIIGDGKDEDLMPVTIIEDVSKDLEQEHELLQVISFTYTGYATKWIRNKHNAAKAVWGKITDAITKEITSDLETMSIDQNKLTAFLVIPLDIIDMGYVFVDGYARAVLKEAVYDGLEASIVTGTGVDMPVGLDRDVHSGVSVSTTDGYPQKTAIKVTSFEKKTYFDLVSRLAKTERGKNRKFGEVCLIVNQADYLSKIAPATTLLTQMGYQGNIFPFPTRPVVSNEIADGKAIMFIPNCYTFCVGGKRNGTIEMDDSFKFLDDARTYKIIQHGDGIADDNTAAILLDISELEELVPSFKVANGTVPVV